MGDDFFLVGVDFLVRRRVVVVLELRCVCCCWVRDLLFSWSDWQLDSSDEERLAEAVDAVDADEESSSQPTFSC